MCTSSGVIDNPWQAVARVSSRLCRVSSSDDSDDGSGLVATVTVATGATVIASFAFCVVIVAGVTVAVLESPPFLIRAERVITFPFPAMPG